MSDALLFQMNHVALSMPPEEISGSRRKELLGFYEKVFNWSEYVEDEKFVEEFKAELKALLGKDVPSCPPLVMLTGSGGFIFLYGIENAMKATPVDHFGFTVDSEDQLNEILDKAKEYKKNDGDVVIVDTAVTSYDIDESLLDRMPGKQVDLINCYIGYRMPLAVELQYYRWNL
jgi:hypothetical protein